MEKRKIAYCEEEIADVVGYVNRNAHIREMEAITQPDQRKRDHMMSNQLFKIFPRLLELQTQHYGLLRPVARLEEIIHFEYSFMRPMGIPLEHPRCVEIPHRRPAHHEETKGAEDGEIHGCVELFHEAVLLGARADIEVQGERAQELLHEKFAGE